MKIIRLFDSLALVICINMLVQTLNASEMQKLDTDFVMAPKVEVVCSTSPNYSAFTATQTGHVKDVLFNIRLSNCRFEKLTNGKHSLYLDAEIEFNLQSQLSHCSSMTTGLLFKIRSTTPSFNWDGATHFIGDLSIENMSETTQDLSFFQFHDELNSTATMTIDSAIFRKSDEPTFDHIFWGKVVLLDETGESEFARELTRNTPVVGKADIEADYSLKLQVEVYQPRGWCWYLTKTGDSTESQRSILSFSAVNGR